MSTAQVEAILSPVALRFSGCKLSSGPQLQSELHLGPRPLRWTAWIPEQLCIRMASYDISIILNNMPQTFGFILGSSCVASSQAAEAGQASSVIVGIALSRAAEPRNVRGD